MDEIVKLVSHLQTTSWYFYALPILLVYIAIAFYKVARSEEGFIVGYRDWALGKWQKSAAFVRLRKDFERLKANVRLKTEVIVLCRLIDADVAYLVAAAGPDRRGRLGRIREALVSGLSRVVAPGIPHRVGLLVPHPEGGHLILCSTAGFSQEARDNLRVPVEGTVAGRCYQTGETITCQDLTADSLYRATMSPQPVYRSVLCVPVKAGQPLYGVLTVEAEPPGAFTGDDVLFLEQFAAKLALLQALTQKPRWGGGRRASSAKQPRTG